MALRAGRRAEAVAALDAVPDSSSQYVTAQLAAARAAVQPLGGLGPEPDEVGIHAAAARVERLPLDPATGHRISAILLARALDLAKAGVRAAPLLGSTWAVRDLRSALEARLRATARLTSDVGERVALVDRANAQRPRTWI